MNRAIWAVVIVLSLVGLPGEAARKGKKDDGTVRAAPLNPEFVEYSQKLDQAKKNGVGNGNMNREEFHGAIPSVMETHHIKGFIDPAIPYGTFPEYFDLRKENRLTPPREQLSFSCWFMAAMTSVESCLTPNETRAFDAESPSDFWNHGFTVILGGDYRMAAAVLLRWDAPRNDKLESYNIWTTGKPDSVQKHVQQAIFFPDRAHPLDNDVMKHHIVNYGALYLAIRMEGSFMNGENHAYYYYGDKGVNHGVTVVGWDDRFSRSLFKTPPPGDGAFIARNTYGERFGDKGYFYISYYDAAARVKALYTQVERADNYGSVYQYDPLGPCTSIGDGGLVWMTANVFRARQKENLSAVGFSTADAHVNYTARVYKHVQPGSPINGVLAVSTSGTLAYPGFFTIPLPEKVPLDQGESFSVVVCYSDSAYGYPAPVELPVRNYSELARAREGESYYSKDGLDWRDMQTRFPNANACIKAYTEGKTNGEVVIDLQLRAIRKKTWLLSHNYCEMTLQLNNPFNIPVREVRVYLKTNASNGYIQRRVIPLSEFKNGVFRVADEYPDIFRLYTYHAAAYDADGAVVGRSHENSISFSK